MDKKKTPSGFIAILCFVWKNVAELFLCSVKFHLWVTDQAKCSQSCSSTVCFYSGLFEAVEATEPMTLKLKWDSSASFHNGTIKLSTCGQDRPTCCICVCARAHVCVFRELHPYVNDRVCRAEAVEPRLTDCTLKPVRFCLKIPAEPVICKDDGTYFMLRFLRRDEMTVGMCFLSGVTSSIESEQGVAAA